MNMSCMNGVHGCCPYESNGEWALQNNKMEGHLGLINVPRLFYMSAINVGPAAVEGSAARTSDRSHFSVSWCSIWRSFCLAATESVLPCNRGITSARAGHHGQPTPRIQAKTHIPTYTVKNPLDNSSGKKRRHRKRRPDDAQTSRGRK